MHIVTEEHCYFCFDTLLAYLQNTEEPVPEFKDGKYPLFVTWNKVRRSGLRLRGCIGNFSPLPLRSGLKEYALTSSLNDTRFDPISLSEVKNLQVAVSLLTNFEKRPSIHDWTIGRHGIWIDFRDPFTHEARSGTYLPEVAREQEWSQVEAVDNLIRKAGYRGRITDELRKGVRLTTYESDKISRGWEDYVKWKEARGEPVLVKDI